MNLKIVEPRVVLLAHTNPVGGGSAERVVAAASKLCYSKSDAGTLLDGLDDEKTSEFLRKLSDYGHVSPVEHISFTFGIEGISRACSHQIVRHRLASYSQQSQRYVDLSSEEVGFIIPPEIKEDEKMLNKYILDVKNEFEEYANFTDDLCKKYIFDGMSDKAALKKALEDARFLLPNACETKLVMTMNARSLLNFFSERCCNRAQWEIRNVAEQMLDLVYPLAPNIFENAGASCLKGPCPEGKMTCGKPKMKKRGLYGKR